MALLIVAAFVAGGGVSLWYVFAHPIQVTVIGRTQCMFTLPNSFVIPESS